MESSCRLCLDPFAENASSIDDPQLKAKMEQVFNFPVDLKTGYPSQVCQSCSYTISEFYVYSEKVRLNQDRLEGGKESFEKVKLEQPESIKCDVDIVGDVVVPKEEEPSDDEDDGEGFSEGEVFAETYEPPVRRRKRTVTRKPRKKRRRLSSDDSDEEDEDGGENSEGTERKKRSYKSKEEREEEFRQIYEFYKIVCDLCKHTTPDLPTLNRHFKEEHDQDGYLLCCKKKMYTPKVMLNHIDYHRNPDEYQCKLCNKTYNSKEYLANHMVKKHNDSRQDLPFRCDQCNQAFRKENQLVSHKKFHEKVQCSICDKEFANKFTVKVHMANMHSDVDRRMICDTCGQEFLNKLCFERHVKEHAGIEVIKRYQCHICNAWIRGERGLHQHMVNLHDNSGQQWICNICGKQSPNFRSLSKHKRVVHCEEKYECEFCGAKFKQPVNLKEHRTIHTGEVLYSCEHCGVTKNSRSNLYVHIKNVHPVEWAAKKRKAEEAKIPKSQA
ncbi:transcription factor grauzone-like [Culex pipiens pallens]|uniref:transcription factor grauzone-like n=1 Tax=Culex pipiens pallens TaxID=42434 RepID=UPI001952C819|nr:transcription factor grauzone-like [Culex pipiens pallens]